MKWDKKKTALKDINELSFRLFCLLFHVTGADEEKLELASSVKTVGTCSVIHSFELVGWELTFNDSSEVMSGGKRPIRALKINKSQCVSHLPEREGTRNDEYCGCPQ